MRKSHLQSCEANEAGVLKEITMPQWREPIHFNDGALAQKLEMDIVSRRFRNLFVTQVMNLSRFRFYFSGP